MIFSKENQTEIKEFQINQTNSNIAPCRTAHTIISPHFIMQCGMMRCTQAAQVFRRIRAALRQWHPMVYQRCLDVPTFCHAHLTEWMPYQLRCTDRVPCSGMVSLFVRWVTVEAVVVPIRFLPVLRAELSIRQVRAAGILAGLQWFSGHTLHLAMLLCFHAHTSRQ